VLETAAPVSDMLFVPGRAWLLTGHRDGSVHVWDVADRTHVRRLHDPVGPRTSVRLAIDEPGRVLAVAQRGVVTVHDLDTGTTPSSFTTFNGVVSLAVDPGGTLVAAAQGATAVVYDVATGKRLRRWNSTVIRSVRLTADGRHVLANFKDGHTVELYDLDAGQPAFVGSAGGPVRASLADPDRWIIAGSRRGLTFFELDTPQAGRRSVRADGGITALAQVDTDEFVAGGGNGQIQVWSLPTHAGPAGPEQVESVLGSGPVIALAWHQGSGLLASAGEDVTVRLWRREPAGFMTARSWGERGVLRGGDRLVERVAFSGDGAYLAVTDGGPLVRLRSPLRRTGGWWSSGPPTSRS